MRSRCDESINSDLNKTREVDKAGSAAAATLMALLPALLTFAPIPTSSIRDLMYTSPAVAFWTAGMLFGLPVAKWSLLPSDRVITAKAIFSHSPGGNIHGSAREMAAESGEPGFDVDCEGQGSLRGILFPGELDRRKPVWKLYTIVTLSGILQRILFLALSRFMIKIYDIRLLWQCSERSIVWYGVWLVSPYTASGIFMVLWNSACRRPEVILHLAPDPMGEWQAVGPEEDGAVPGYAPPTWGRSFKMILQLMRHFWLPIAFGPM
jgi:hypothetical protein